MKIDNIIIQKRILLPLNFNLLKAYPLSAQINTCIIAVKVERRSEL